MASLRLLQVPENKAFTSLRRTGAHCPSLCTCLGVKIVSSSFATEFSVGFDRPFAALTPAMRSDGVILVFRGLAAFGT